MTQAASPTLGSSGAGMAGLVFDPSVPAYDAVVLMELAHEAGETAAKRFLDEYWELLPRRQDRILSHLANGDMEAAEDAIISLKITSAMVGAVRLSSYCGHLQDQLSLGNIADTTEVASDLGHLVSAFVRAVNGR
ncbi:Hpt domain-containing protein [Arthrobacter sp. NPDC056493]|uniref:Hpt domain-containing protein n=1 Tax=Arthrobacter sp. NPDC056493 TaxID=3345839 RepID=UPI0036711882